MAAWLRWILVPLRRQFLLACLRSIDLIGRPAAEDRVGSIGVVVADPTPDPGSSLTAGLEGIEEDAFVFERSPQPLDEGRCPSSGRDRPSRCGCRPPSRCW